jgi:hypothetical protein
VNNLSLLRAAFLKTRAYEAASAIRFSRENRSLRGLFVSVLAFIVAVIVATAS